jgi:ATP-dependent RNA helicase RhlE
MHSASRRAGAQGFAALSLVPALHQATIEAGYTEPTPLQSQAIPAILAGRDVLACAQTGGGRTAAFVLPILHHLLARQRNGRLAIRALVVASTHERAVQIEACFRRFAAGSGLRVCAASGAADRIAQTEALRRGVEVLVATPTRLFDMLCQSEVDLGLVRHFVLDEAGRVLDPGFLDRVRRIATAIPTERQTLVFSTSLHGEVRELADRLSRDPVLVIAPELAADAAVSPGGDEERPSVRAADRLTRSQQARRNPRKPADVSVRSRSAKPPDNAGTANRDR